MMTVIAFDISSDQKRYQAVKVILEYASRVQKSVFESPDLARAGYLRMRSRIEGLVDPTTDSVRYYSLCQACASRTEHFGVGPGILDIPDDVEIV